MRQSDATPATTDATPARQSATIGDAAKALGVSVRTVQRRIEHGQMSITERDGKRFVELPNVAPTDATEARQSATVDATPRQSDATERDTNRERIAELKSEVAFLRNLVEAQQRDAVELRQSLKRALDIAPRQLEAAPIEAQGAAKSGAAGNDGPAMPEGARSGIERQGETDWNSVYGQIADQLESNR